MPKRYCREYLSERDAGLLTMELHSMHHAYTGYGTEIGSGDGEGDPRYDFYQSSGREDGSGVGDQFDISDEYVSEQFLLRIREHSAPAFN